MLLYRDTLLNTVIFIVVCIMMQVIVFAFIIYSHTVSSLKLEQVVIISRHHIRAPLSKNLDRLTPQHWPHWKEPLGYLTEKGFILEGYMGKYFSSWLTKEGLLSRICPTEEDFYVYSNSIERTMCSAEAFSSNLYPDCNVTIHHSKPNKSDPVFSPFIHNSTKMFKKIALEEMRYMLNNLNLTDSYSVLEDILKYNESDFCKIDNKCHLATDKNKLDITLGKKPKVTGPLKLSNEAIDAFLMGYYNGFPATDVAWGKLDTLNKWHSILDIQAGYHNVTFCAKHVAIDIARPLIKYLTNIFFNKNTRVTLLMGHDANINTILKGMSFNLYTLSNSFSSTPVGGKIVFQKWLNQRKNEYLLKINYVYQTNKQLRDGEVLTKDNPPQFQLLELNHCKIDEEGFCLWNDFISFLNRL